MLVHVFVASLFVMFLSLRTLYWLWHVNRKYTNPEGDMYSWRRYGDTIRILSITTKPSWFDLGRIFWNYEVEMLINGQYHKVDYKKGRPNSDSVEARLAWYSAVERFDHKR